MPCPPSVPISIIPPVSQGVGPLVWANGSQVARLTVPLNPSWLVYDGSVTRWGDGSATAPVYLPALAEYPPDVTNYLVAIDASGKLIKTQSFSGTNLIGGNAGSLVYQLATSNTSFLPIGINGQVLKVSSGGFPEWQTPLAPTASNVLYNEGSAGAVTRTVQDKLKEIISSYDFSSEDYAVNAAVNELPVNFWANETPPPNIRRISDRVFIGEAVYSSGNETQGTNESWVYNDFGAYWLERGSQLFTLPDSNGYIGEFSAVRTSTVDPVANIGIGMASLAWNNYVGSRFAWAGYFEISREAGAYVSYGLEIAGKNKGDNHSRTPYALDSGGVIGIWMAGGGDPTYNGPSVNPNNTAIAIGKNSNTWNTGICFDYDGLTNSGTNTFSAIKMAKGHQLEWWASNSLVSAIIRSDGTDPGAIGKSLIFKNTKVSIETNSVTDLYTFDLGASPANGLAFSSGVSGSNVSSIYATGTDTDIDLQLNPKGSAAVRFGTYTAGAPTATGYIVIKDASGTIRKLLVG